MKKLYPNIIAAIILLSSLVSIAQNTEYNPSSRNEANKQEYDSTFNAFKKLYIDKLDSDIHYRIMDLSKEFVRKMNHPEKSMALINTKYPLPWIKENLSTTFFESYGEAIKEWEHLSELMAISYEQNREYYEMKDKILKKWGVEMLDSVTQEIRREQPQKFKT
ncbi:hypothetical protein E0W68_08295 [Flavobacterium salilacus subsp. salilacus]|uniref:hypothetical protein n=1 Tax=Flavobacterium TaxID=237 RepID=UPI001074B574|nr:MULTISPECIES: hypothetical protein [Flavobacterium]KAF2518742.1 hypothetical protein E0W68_08295 [Flavobacterium salilacus subsp. salilacus]MBE1613708.1 hypothetical protein [Flavobacterium sp. SaA2.13]